MILSFLETIIQIRDNKKYLIEGKYGDLVEATWFRSRNVDLDNLFGGRKTIKERCIERLQ